MIFTISDQHSYTPEWNGNRELKQGEQFKAIIAHPSALDVAKVYEDTKEDTRMFEFCMYVKSLPGLKIQKGKKVVDATPKDVYQTSGMLELVHELRAEYEKLIVNKKK